MLFRETTFLNAFGLARVPLIALCRPKVLECNDSICRVELPFSWPNKNHLGSIYFGALAIGAEVASGFPVVWWLRKNGIKASFAFKAVKGHFLKRAEGPVIFENRDIGRLIAEAKSRLEGPTAGERFSLLIPIEGWVNGEKVAEFEFDFSMKVTLKN